MDHFDEYSTTWAAPYNSAMVVTPDDDTDLPVVGRALNIITGDAIRSVLVTVTLLNDETVQLHLVSGKLHELRIKRLHETGTENRRSVGASFVTLW